MRNLIGDILVAVVLHALWYGAIAAAVLIGVTAVSAADKPAIDPAVAAAWGFSATPAVQPMPEAMPSYRLYQNSRGVWYQVPVQTPQPVREVRPPIPFPEATVATIAPAKSGTVPSTSGVVVRSQPSAATWAGASTSTGRALTAVRYGRIENCST